MHQQTLLCIDDDTAILQFRKTLLETYGYHVLVTTNGKQGLQLFGRYPVDAVIVDYDMPAMNGARLASELKRLKPTVPIVMSSAYAVQCQDDVIDAYVGKDAPNGVLLERIEELLTESAQRRAAPHPAPALLLVGSLTAATAILLGKALSQSFKPSVQ